MIAMRVAYLLNQYPKVSHSFIRTEIMALEAAGIVVERIAVRGWDADVVDPLDRQELAQTRYVLRHGWPLLAAVLSAFLRRPLRFGAALRLAMQLARRGERGRLIHLIYLAEACLVTRWTIRSDIEHIHAHFGSNATAVAMLTRVLGGPPFSFTVHGPEEFDKPLQLKLREKMRHASAVVAITSYCRGQLYRWADLKDWPKIKVIGCALDDRFWHAAETVEPDPMEGGFVCVGRLCEQKGQLILLEALALLRQRGYPIRLTLAGDGEMRGAIEAAIARLSLGDLVTITGWVSAAQVTGLLARSRALVLPSFAEGLPIVIMEAMAMGCPIVTTFVAGIPELVRDGLDGFLIPAGDVVALTDALQNVVTAPADTLLAIRNSAAARVRERHSSDRQADQLIAAWKALAIKD